VWLCEDLCRLYPGTIIPTLPEKQTMGRMKPEFVEARRRALEKFLTRITDHHELGHSPAYIKFLQADEAAFQEAKESTKAAKTKMSEKARSWFHNTANSITAATTSKGKKSVSTMIY
jgi:sorting nexin-1/2